MTPAWIIPVLVALLVLPAPAATAFVQSESGRTGPGWMEITARRSLVQGWRIDGAILFVHVRSGKPPARLDLRIEGERTSMRLEARSEHDGWVSVVIPAAVAEAAVRREIRISWRGDAGFDGATVPGRTPYLVVSGRSP